jgi:hypothetical protein
LGRPWQYDRRVIHDGFTNRYNFVKDGKTFKLAPLTPKQVYEDQLKLKSEIEQKRKSEKENREVLENKEKRVEPWEKKERGLAERKGKPKMSFYAKESEVKRAFLADQPMIFLVYKESYLNLDETNQSLPSLDLSLLQEFDDVFPEEMLSGLPPIRGIEHQIDLYPEQLFQTDQPIGVIRRSPRSFKGKLKICWARGTWGRAWAHVQYQCY